LAESNNNTQTFSLKPKSNSVYSGKVQVSFRFEMEERLEETESEDEGSYSGKEKIGDLSVEGILTLFLPFLIHLLCSSRDAWIKSNKR